jgi:hypothetical protein
MIESGSGPVREYVSAAGEKRLDRRRKECIDGPTNC